MIALAVADRPLVRQLLAAGELEVEYLETTGPLVDSAVESFPGQRLLLHNSVWNWSLSHTDALHQQDVLPRTLAMIDRMQVPWLSIHLGFSAEEVTFDGWMQPVNETLPESQLVETITATLRAFAAALPVPLLIENLDYNPGGAYESICHPAFIAAVLETAEVDFLFDLAHARVSASRLRMSIEAYVAQLPLHRIRQLHISGPRWRDGLLTDTHDNLLDDDYALLEQLLAQSQPQAVTLEYGKDAELLKADLARLKAMLAD